MPAATRIGIDTPQMEAYMELIRAEATLARELDRELQEQRGISGIEYLSLLQLRYASGGQLPLGDLAAAVHLTKSGVTRLVDRLVAAAFVERTPCPDDRRSTFATITSAGRAELRRAWPIHRRGIEAHFGARLTDAEAATLRDLLRRIMPGQDL